MVKLLTTMAVFEVLLNTMIPRALAQTAQGQTEDVDSPADRDLRPVPSSSASPFDHVDSARLPSDSTKSTAAEAGLASPYALSAKVVQGQSWARAVGGYDSAAQAFRVSSAAETALTSYLAFRADFDHGPSTSATDRVSFGFKLQLLRQNANGLDLGLGLFYQPNDFRREGNIVGALMLGRRFDRVAVLGSALLGSDSEGDDQEVDGRLGTLIRVSRLVELGLDSRFRAVLSSDTKRNGSTSIDWEMALLPSANLRLGPLLLIGEAGFTALQTTDLVGEPGQHKNFRTGILVMSGLGFGF